MANKVTIQDLLDAGVTIKEEMTSCSVIAEIEDLEKLSVDDLVNRDYKTKNSELCYSGLIRFRVDYEGCGKTYTARGLKGAMERATTIYDILEDMECGYLGVDSNI